MRLSRFFIDAPLSLGEHELPEAQAHYIGRVLRMAEAGFFPGVILYQIGRAHV